MRISLWSCPKTDKRRRSFMLRMDAKREAEARTRLILMVLISRGSSYSSWWRGVGVVVAWSIPSQCARFVCVRMSLRKERRRRAVQAGRQTPAAAAEEEEGEEEEEDEGG